MMRKKNKTDLKPKQNIGWVNHGFCLCGDGSKTENDETNSILIDDLFKKAKIGDRDAATKLWWREWNKNAPENIRRLRNAVDPEKKVVFISTPGTSKKNQIPLMAAQALSESLGENGYFINGDKYFKTLHIKMMKKIQKGQRLFHPRGFEPFEDTIKLMKEKFPDAQFFVTEDLLTTGNSSNSFRRCLEKNGIHVSGIISLKGSVPQTIPANLVQKIRKFFLKNDILSFPNNQEDADKEAVVRKFCGEITEKEASTLGFQIAYHFEKADEKTKQVFRDAFETLYRIKVEKRHDLLPEMDRLGDDISDYFEKEKTQSQNKQKEGTHENMQKHTQTKNHQTQTDEKRASISETLGKNSTRREGLSDNQRTAQARPDSAQEKIRNDTSDTKQSGNNIVDVSVLAQMKKQKGYE